MAEAREPDFGTIAGRIEAPGGTPVGGAVISVFGSGRGSFTAVSDIEGRFSLELPPGRYTVRTLAGGFVPAAARRVLVASERELLLDISLAANEAAASLASTRIDPASVSELRWLIRHKRRSVLEERGAAEILTANDLSVPLPTARVEGASSWRILKDITVPLALLFLSNRVLNPALVLVEVPLNAYVLWVNRAAVGRVLPRVAPMISISSVGARSFSQSRPRATRR